MASSAEPRRITLRDMLTVVVLVLVFYVLITLFFGFKVGRQTHTAQANPFSGPGSQVLGTSATETDALQKSGLPWFITGSPSFWLALHAAE